LINTELTKQAGWFCENKMALKVSKTIFIMFLSKGKPIHDTIVKNLYYDNKSDQCDPTLITIFERCHSIHPDTSCRIYNLQGVYLDKNSFSPSYVYCLL
jgi:hypothetical protein